MLQSLRRRRVRSDVSLVTDVLAAIKSSRIAGEPIPVEQLPVVIGLVNLHADVLADMPAKLEGRRGRQPDVLEQPNPDEPRRATVHKIVQSMMWTGNAYVLDLGRDAVTVLNPHTVAPVYDDDDQLRVASWYVDGMPVKRDQVRHVKINDDPRGGPLGRSVFATASEPLAMYGHAYRYLTDFFAGGGNPSTVLQRTDHNALYSPDQAAKDWITARQERRPAVLPMGFALEVPANNGELEAVARILEHSASEVARVLNAPPSLVNVTANGSMSYTNTGGEFRRWLATSLAPTWIGRLEDMWSQIVDAPVRMDHEPLFRLVDPTENAGTGSAPQMPARPQLEAVS